MTYKLLIILFCILASCTKNQYSVTDVDGNNYSAIRIGDQIWMTENLKVTHFRNGDPIPDVNENEEWSNINYPAYCNYNNDEQIGNELGRLYNWHVISDKRNIAPLGWHIPSDEEWIALTNRFGGIGIAGGSLKMNDFWKIPNRGATNLSGFSALPIGCRNNYGYYNDISRVGMWWSATEFNPLNSKYRKIYHYTRIIEGELFDETLNKNFGLSIRCIKDK